MWLFLTIRAVNKDIKGKENFTQNHVHNISRLCLTNFVTLGLMTQF